MKTKLTIVSVIFVAAIASALPAQAHIFHRFAGCPTCAYGSYDGQASTNDGTAANGGSMPGGYSGVYYDVAWGMPMTLVVPPTARTQTDYSWGVPSVRISPITSQFQYQSPAPSSSYQMGQYPAAPPQPSDTQQIGDYYGRAPGGR